jgi:hypothetical protein
MVPLRHGEVELYFHQSLPWYCIGVNGQIDAPAALILEKQNCNPLDVMLNGPHNLSGGFEEETNLITHAVNLTNPLLNCYPGSSRPTYSGAQIMNTHFNVQSICLYNLLEYFQLNSEKIHR